MDKDQEEIVARVDKDQEEIVAMTGRDRAEAAGASRAMAAEERTRGRAVTREVESADCPPGPGPCRKHAVRSSMGGCSYSGAVNDPRHAHAPPGSVILEV